MSDRSFPELSTWVGAREVVSARPFGDIVDPNTRQSLAANRASDADQVEAVLASVSEAHRSGVWADRSADKRGGVLLRWADWLDEHAEHIAFLDALNSGVPISTTRLFAGSLGDTVRTAVRIASEVLPERVLPAERRVVLRRVPWGPGALIAPWNAPAALAVKKLAFALAAGNTAVLKPSHISPWSAQLVMRGLYESGLPDGVAGMVLGGGEVGAALVSDRRIRAVAMTGSTATGKSIAAAAGSHLARLRLELGSNNPAVVQADADVPATATALAAGSLKLSGQWCEAPRRVLVARSLLGSLVDCLAAEFGAWRIGSSVDDDTRLGPVAFEERRAELERQCADLEAQGGSVVRAAEVPASGSFFPPTIVVGEQLIPDGELFGPLLTVEPVDSDAEAVTRGNEGQVGLAAYVFGGDEDAAAPIGRRLLAGEVKVNGTSVLDMADDSAQSFFGDAGIGGHGDADVMDFFSGKQVIGSDRPGLVL